MVPLYHVCYRDSVLIHISARIAMICSTINDAKCLGFFKFCLGIMVGLHSATSSRTFCLLPLVDSEGWYEPSCLEILVRIGAFVFSLNGPII